MSEKRVLSWNVNGIRAAERKGFLDWLYKDGADIVCVQETKAWPEQLKRKLRKPDGFFTYFNWGVKKGYSGVAIYTRQEPNEVIEGLGIERFNAEGRSLIAVFDDVMLFNLYCPNGRKNKERLDYKMDYYDALLEYTNEARKRGKKIIVCGDFNTAHNEIDLARPGENSKVSGFLPLEREWISKFISNGYVDTFRHFFPDEIKYSWWDYKTRARGRNVGWRLDYFFISDDLIGKVRDSFILNDIMGSDHCPVGIHVDL